MAITIEKCGFGRLVREAEKANVSASTRLVAKLSERLVVPPEELVKLLNSRVMIAPGSFGGNVGYEHIGKVLSVSGRDVLFAPEVDRICYPSGKDLIRDAKDKKPKVIKTYFTTDDPYGYGSVIYDAPSVRCAISQRVPTKIIIHFSESDTDNFWRDITTFEMKDSALYPILEEGLRANPSIKNSKDLARLTQWVHDKISYKGYRKSEDDYSDPSLGEDIFKYGVVCKQIATIALGILELNGIACVPISTYSPRYKKGHVYLGVDRGLVDQTEKVICDPTWNISGTYNEVISTLISRGSVTDFHLPDRAIAHAFYPSWESIAK